MFDSLKYLILSLTCRCNLQCKYCYQAAGKHGMDMSDEVMEKVLQQADTGHPLFIQMTGGEPTLVPEMIEKIGQKCQQMQIRPRLAIQTNGTLLTPALINIFQRFDIEVGISIDGPPDIQNELRGNADLSLRGMAMLEEAGLIFRITTVVSSTNVHNLDKLVLLLANFGSCRGIGLDLLVNKGRGNTSNILPAQAQHLRTGITRMVHTLNGLNTRRKNPILLREMELIKSGKNGHTFCHAASGQSLAVQSNGSLFPCGQTLGDPSFACGSIANPLLRSYLHLGKIQLQSEVCNTCPLLNRCPGECPSRIHYNGTKQSTLVCELYRCLDTLQ